jgi:putative transposase
MPDHVHLFISVELNTSPNSVIKAFKGRSSGYMREEFRELLRLPSLWTRSYFISTAGNVSSETIQKYIENQTRK